MNRRTILLTACLLTASLSSAREPQAPPSPVSTRESGQAEFSLFVGRFGESIKLRNGWAAEARMQGPIEVVNFHVKQDSTPKRLPFQPKAADYIQDNFTLFGLMQLMVIPKNIPGGLASLEALRSAKEDELKRSGADYKILDESPTSNDWPPRTFHVLIERPYSLWQTYSESAGEFYIFTHGSWPRTADNGPTRDDINDYRLASGDAVNSLGAYLRSIYRKPWS